MNTLYAVKFARKRKGLTDYRKRLKLLMSGKPRLIIRRSLNNITSQVAEYTPSGDIVKVSAVSTELKKYGWNFGTGNVPAAYLTGQLLASKIRKKKVDATKVILDVGIHSTVKGSRIYAALKGVIDAGISVPAGEGIFPVDERLTGQHIQHYYQNNKNKQQFATYKDANIAEQVKKITSTLSP